MQNRKLLKTLRPIEIPPRYWANLAAFITLSVAAVGVALAVHLWVTSQ